MSLNIRVDKSYSILKFRGRVSRYYHLETIESHRIEDVTRETALRDKMKLIVGRKGCSLNQASFPRGAITGQA